MGLKKLATLYCTPSFHRLANLLLNRKEYNRFVERQNHILIHFDKINV